MTRGVGSYTCPECRRTFGGQWTYRLAHVYGRCLKPRELRKRGLVQRPEGTWVRKYEPNAIRQVRLFRVGRPRLRGREVLRGSRRGDVGAEGDEPDAPGTRGAA